MAESVLLAEAARAQQAGMLGAANKEVCQQVLRAMFKNMMSYLRPAF